MRRIEGVLDIAREDADGLKRYALLFDQLHVDYVFDSAVEEDPKFEYLCKTGFLSLIEKGAVSRHSDLNPRDNQELGEASRLAGGVGTAYPPNYQAFIDYGVRRRAIAVAKANSDVDVVPICKTAISLVEAGDAAQQHHVLSVAVEQFPTPGPNSSWEDILNFKAEMQDKDWRFRRFLHTLATRKQTEAEIRDDIEWTLNEYTKAMKIHHLKAGSSFAEVYLMPVIELVEDIAKFNWSKIAKVALSVKKRQVELMEAEMKDPGRECAYVFEAQKRFGGSR
jgi:hypothetical protein